MILLNQRIYIDINCEVGKRPDIINQNIPYSFHDFLTNHNNLGIDLSLATSSKSAPYSIVAGNNEIIDYSSKSNRLLPIATLYPGFEYDIKDYHSYLSELISKRICGIKLDMKKLFIFNSNLFSVVFKFAQNFKLPILVNWDDIEDKEKFFNIIKEYSDLNVIVLNVNWSFRKYIFNYMEHNKNIYIGVNGFIYQNVIEDVCKNFTSKRLLFATGYPFFDIGSAKAMVEYADITNEEKDDIAYKNAVSLFNIGKITKMNYDLSNDKLALMVDNGVNLKDNLNFSIIDAHTHFVSDEAKSADWIGGRSTLESLLKSCDRIGISGIFTSPMDGLLFDGLTGNNVLEKAIKSSDFPINGYVTANPFYKEDIELALKKLCDPRYVGLKLYPSKNHYPYDGKLYEPLFKKLIEINKYFLLHGTIDEAKRLLNKYEDLKVLLAHSTQSYCYMDDVIELLNRYPKLYIDICNRYITNGAIEYLVKNGNPNRIVFGSDCSLLSQTAHVGWVAYSNISYSDKEKIFSKNIKTLVKR